MAFQQTSSSHARSDDALVPRPLAAMGFAIQASAFLCSASSADAKMSFGHGLAGMCGVRAPTLHTDVLPMLFSSAGANAARLL